MRWTWNLASYFFITIVISYCSCQNCHPGEPHLELRGDEVLVENGKITYKDREYQQGEFLERRGLYYICQCDISPCIKTCTDYEKGEYFPPERGFKVAVQLGNGLTKDVDLYDQFHVYSETKDCESSFLDLDVEAHTISSNGSLKLGSEIAYDSFEYCVANGKLLMLLCPEIEDALDMETEHHVDLKMQYWESLISSLFLLLSIIVIIISKETNTIIGKLSVSFCATFMIEKLTLAVYGYKMASSATLTPFSRIACKAIAFILIYTGYSSRLWLNAMSLELLLQKRVVSRKIEFCRCLGFALYSTLTPLTIGIIIMIISNIYQDAGHRLISEDFCWILDIHAELIYFTGPNLVILFFSLTILITTCCKSEVISIKWVFISIVLTALKIFQLIILIISIIIYKNGGEPNIVLRYVTHFFNLEGIVVFATFCFYIFRIRETSERDNSPASELMLRAVNLRSDT